MLLIESYPRVLAIGAHPDDIEIGTGGFIHRLTSKYRAHVHFLVLTEGVQGPVREHAYRGSTRRTEAFKAAKLLKVAREDVSVLRFPDCQLHEHEHEIIREIEAKLYGENGRSNFDIILSHAGEDTHADHRATYEATLSAARSFQGAVLHYQAPSTKPNGFRPTFFVRLDKRAIERKNRAIQAHISQRDKAFMQESRTFGMANNWALFHRQPAGTYLEAFEVYKSFF